ncbi:MAG: peptidase S9, partial [Salibacteraceae bacterium]|nr:peptidase S9 [Salibacteraceae bacterium]
MKQIAFFFGLILSLTSFAQNDVLTPENLWKLQRVYGEQVSPDGKTIIYTQKTYELEKNSGMSFLYSVPVADGKPAMVSDITTSVYDAQWRP